jgi:sugar/nucleoside kinase (ribokinase family)
MKKIKILAVGDIAAEPFIKIKSDEAETSFDHKENDWNLCFDYGSKTPYESALLCYAVGNSPNVAITASRLGLKTSLVSYLGNDDIAKLNIKKLKAEKIETKYVKKIKGLGSNFHYVLCYKKERTILVHHIDYPYSFNQNIKEPEWLYLSSLSENSLLYHKEIEEYLISHPNVSFAIQPGTFQIRLGLENMRNLYKRANLFCANKKEVEKMLGKETTEDIKKLLEEIYALGPKLVIITDGINGSYLYDGMDVLFMKAFYIEEKTIENTGAGDAFIGSFLSAKILGKNNSESLVWASLNASSVVEKIGPHDGLLNKKELERRYKEVNLIDYPKKIN